MAYSAEISRANPTCFVFLVDRSGSMADSFGGESGQCKADSVADALNRLLQTLVLRCAKSEGVRDYFHIGVIGYGEQAGFALGGGLAGRGLVPVSEVGNNPLRVETRTRKVPDGAGGLVEQSIKFPVWFEPLANGRTPMCQALEQARSCVADFVSRTPRCFPPILLNITDGEATDGDPEPYAEALRALTTADGPVLLFNLHISARSDRPIKFPSTEANLPDEHAQRLFRMSSELPSPMLDGARAQGLRVDAGARGFVFNADLVSVIEFLDIGTRVDRNLR
jgi:hypothetical protein